jgi:hypothetical protein
MKRFPLIALFFIMLAALPALTTSCTTAPSSRVAQVQTLKAVGHTAEAAVAASADLYKAKQITDAQARQVIALYDLKFQPAYRLAVSAVNANLDSIASPELVALAAQISALVLTFTQK